MVQYQTVWHAMDFPHDIHKEVCYGGSYVVGLEHVEVDPFWKMVNNHQDDRMSSKSW